MRVLVFGSRNLTTRHLDAMVTQLECVAAVALSDEQLVLVHGAGPRGRQPGAIGADMLSEVAAHLAWRGRSRAVRRYPVEPGPNESWGQAAARRDVAMAHGSLDVALCFHTDERLGHGSRITAEALERRPAGSRYLLVLMSKAGEVLRGAAMSSPAQRALDEKRLARVSWTLRQRAWAGGPYRGTTSGKDMAYLMSCAHLDALTQTRLFFTRDTGHHTSGWWKNPDYERCLHLSISPAPHPAPPDGAVDFSKAVQAAWVRTFFAENLRWVWAEPPYSPKGKASEVWHFRLFTDPTWRPLLPRGEAYGRELTERGWRSASEVLELGQEPTVLLMHKEHP